MKPHTLVVVGIMIGISAGCTSEPENSREGPEGKKISIAVTDKKLSITQNENKKFSVSVMRKQLNGPVQLKFDLPEGLKIQEPQAKWIFKQGATQQFFTLHIEKDAKPQKEVPVRVTAIHEEMEPVTATLKVEVVESLESKKARQQAFAKNMDDKLNQTKNTLESAGKTIMEDTQDVAKRSEYLKRVANLYKKLDETRKKYDELAAAPVETWERTKQEVETAVTNLEQAVDQFRKELKQQ